MWICTAKGILQSPGINAAFPMINRLKQGWRILFFLVAVIPGACVAPAFPQAKDSHEFNDAHFHLTNNVQEGPDIREFLKMMGQQTGRAALFGIPLQQEWSYRIDRDRRTTSQYFATISNLNRVFSKTRRRRPEPARNVLGRLVTVLSVSSPLARHSGAMLAVRQPYRGLAAGCADHPDGGFVVRTLLIHIDAGERDSRSIRR